MKIFGPGVAGEAVTDASSTFQIGPIAASVAFTVKITAMDKADAEFGAMIDDVSGDENQACTTRRRMPVCRIATRSRDTSGKASPAVRKLFSTASRVTSTVPSRVSDTMWRSGARGARP